MVATIPPVLLEADPAPNSPLRYGLFQAAVGPLNLPVHARNGGLQYVTALCGEGFGYEIECIDDQNDKSAAWTENGSTTVLGAPFMVFATMQCGSAGFSFAEQRAMIVERLMGVEQSVVEEVFSTGTFGQSPGLLNADGIETVVGSAPATNLAGVLSELETARYCGTATTAVQYGPTGVLHVAIPVLNALKAEHLVEFDGTRWRTPMGTTVSAGCYANNDPAGVAPAAGTFWMYLTGQTVIWRTPDSEIQVAPVEGSLNRTTNQMMMLAEREYVVTYECGGFAKAVTLWP